MSLLFVLQQFVTAEPLARSVAPAALRITVVVVANDLTGPATDCNALPRPLALLHESCANHYIQSEKRHGN